MRDALALAEGFVFLPARCGDRLAEDLLGSLLAQWAAGERTNLAGRSLRGETQAAEILADLRDAARPCLFWFFADAAEDGDLDDLFLLLNQKREVISQSAGAPMVLAMCERDWDRFRRRAPDFWSIHQAVFRFSPGLVTTRSATRSIDSSAPSGRMRGLPAMPSGARRLRREDLLPSPAEQFVGRRTELDALAAMLGTPGARVLVHGPRGIGKTTLLRHACARVVDVYPDGIWWFGPNDQASAIPGGTDSVRALVVIDDLEDAALLEALRLGSESSLLVSSVERLGTSTFTGVLELGGIDSELGSTLLRGRHELSEAVARRIATAAGGNPEAISRVLAVLESLDIDARSLDDQPELLVEVMRRASM